MKKLDKIILTIILLAISLIITVHFRVKNNVGNSATTINRTKKLASEYDLLKKDNEKLNTEIEKYRKNSMNLKKLKIFEEISGYSNISGEGLEILVEEKNFVFSEYQTELSEERKILLDIVNNLNAAGAKGISINEERYTSFTEIVVAGNNIEVNGKTIGLPYIIKVIGNTNDLENALNLKGGVVWNTNRDDILNIKIEKKNIDIPFSKYIREYVDEKK